MKIFSAFIVSVLGLFSSNTDAGELKKIDISEVISKEEFALYKNVADFIEKSPKVTIIVKPDQEDVSIYGTDVVKSLTGSDCNRDGVMDDNATCNAVYYKLWMIYER